MLLHRFLRIKQAYFLLVLIVVGILGNGSFQVESVFANTTTTIQLTAAGQFPGAVYEASPTLTSGGNSSNLHLLTSGSGFSFATPPTSTTYVFTVTGKAGSLSAGSSQDFTVSIEYKNGTARVTSGDTNLISGASVSTAQGTATTPPEDNGALVTQSAASPAPANTNTAATPLPTADSKLLITPINLTNPTKFKTIGEFIAYIPSVLFYFIGVASIFGFLVGAYTYFVSDGKEDMLQKGKTQMVGSIIALVIVLAAGAIVAGATQFAKTADTSSLLTK